jgi:hypothetical protein
VRATKGHLPDWRDAASYAPLLEADRSILAWEWLRRDPVYREAAARAPRGLWTVAAGEWGLAAFEPPGLAAPLARPVWSAEAHPFILPVLACGPGEARDTFDLGRFESLLSLVMAPGRGEHLLLSDGLRSIRLDGTAGTLARGRVRLRYLLSGLESAEKPLLTLRRLLALARTGDF